MGSMAGRPSTVRGRELGGELRKFREAAGLSGADLARKIDWSPTKVSRMETGTRSVSEVDVAIYLSNCGVKRRAVEDLLEVARGNTDGRYWLSANLRSLVVQENIASEIACYEPALIPGLLQTEDYTRALFKWAKIITDEERIETLVQARMQRQSLLGRYMPPRLKFFVHEHALRSQAGSPSVMHEQMLRLLFADTRPQSPVRIVPSSAGPYGSLGGAFVLLDYAEHPPAAYVPVHTTSVFMEGREDIRSYRRHVSRLEDIALSAEQSRAFLASLANEYDIAASVAMA